VEISLIGSVKVIIEHVTSVKTDRIYLPLTITRKAARASPLSFFGKLNVLIKKFCSLSEVVCLLA
jgi:hypothetical protein